MIQIAAINETRYWGKIIVGWHHPRVVGVSKAEFLQGGWGVSTELQLLHLETSVN